MTNEQLEKLLSELSLEEKLGQLTQVEANFYLEHTGSDVTGPEANIGLAPDDLKLMGSVLNCVGADNCIQLQKTFMENHPHHIPLLIMQDVIHGYRTQYPVPLGLACSFNDELTEACARMAAKEASLEGVHVTFGPMVDISRDARWGRCMESCGEDVTLTKRMGSAMVRGFVHDGGENTVASCVKHFCAYGAPEAGRDYNNVELSERTLRQTYLPGYKAALDAGARWIMPSFNSIGHLPMTANGYILKDILRDEWGFDGAIISDYNAYREIQWHGAAESMKDVAEITRHNGVDMEMMSATTFLHSKELLEEGRITMEEINTSVMRILQEKNRLGLFENPYRFADKTAAESYILSASCRELAQQAAEESAVLLKNEGALLPFGKDMKKLALIGPFAAEKGIKGAWACAGRDEETVSVYEGIKTMLPDVEILVDAGCSYNLLNDTPVDVLTANAEKAAALAKEADAVLLCIGEYQDYSGEGNSRCEIRLPLQQRILAEKVLKENPNAAVLLFGGRPQDITDIEPMARAILYMWQPGTMGGAAAARLVFGEVAPSGKLSMTFPRSVGQEPIYYAHQTTGRPVADPNIPGAPFPYTSRYLDMPTSPLYAFGYGLSYTTFEYSPVTLDTDTLTVDGTITASAIVKNTGNVTAKESVQFYVRDLIGTVARPVKELKDFKKITLAPGEEIVVSFTITEEDLRYWGKDLTYGSDAGTFHAFIGPDSNTQNYAEFKLVK